EGLELEEVQVWDLLDAFGKVMTSIGRGPSRHDVRYDDTPIELYAAEIVAALEEAGPATFNALFDGCANRLMIIGRFLALLELIRSRRVRAEQDRSFGEIYLFLMEVAEEFQEIDEAAEPADPPAKPHIHPQSEPPDAHSESAPE
ncbi:MAG: segregation/condensation protein A, partial [Planctomycetota bacterium]